MTRTLAPWQRHLAAIAVGTASTYGFWLARSQWDPEMRLWKAVGDGSLVLLLVTVAIGPLARLWTPARRTLPWRRETGIWFTVLALAHTLLILDGWTRWSLDRFLGFEFVEQLGRQARMEPGFGLANVLGLVAVVWAIVLAATSSDRAMRWLGGASWRWLHTATYVVFYLVVIHAGYFLFLHYTESFHRRAPGPDAFRIPFLVASVGVVGLQMAAFVRTVRRRRPAATERDRTSARRVDAPAG